MDLISGYSILPSFSGGIRTLFSPIKTWRWEIELLSFDRFTVATTFGDPYSGFVSMVTV